MTIVLQEEILRALPAFWNLDPMSDLDTANILAGGYLYDLFMLKKKLFGAEEIA